MELRPEELREVEAICSDFGFELVLHQLSMQRDGVRLELVIDKPGGISSDDCELVAERAGGFLDTARVFAGGYSLRVSSPGLDRPLVKPAHFAAAVGCLVKLSLKTPIQGQKHFNGRLMAFEDNMARLEAEDGSGKEWLLPFADIAKANVKYEWDD